MGQQRNKVEKRRRRANYLKRLKSRRAAGLTPKKRVVQSAAPAGDDVKKKAVKKKVVKKKAATKAATKAAPETEAPAAEAPAEG
ncbi:MAG: hypothetical protein ACKO2G_13020 [Verrucomicrobiales bacterium]